MSAARKACRWAGAMVAAEAVLGAGGHGERASALANVRTTGTDAIVLAGGRDGGSVGALRTAAEMLSVLYSDLRRQWRPVVLFAGNRGARDTVAERLGGGFDLRVVDNVLSPDGEETPWPLQRALRQLYGESLGDVPGMARLAGWCSAPVMATHEAIEWAMGMLARQVEPAVGFVGLDLGVSGATIGWLERDGYRQARVADTDMRGGASAATPEACVREIRQWLPAESSPENALCRFETAGLRPWVVPETAEDVQLSVARGRWAMGRAAAAVDWRPLLPDGGRPTGCHVAARGGAIADCPRDALTAQAVSEGLGMPGPVQVLADWASIWPQLGVVAQGAPEAATDVLMLDGVRVQGATAMERRP
jgi:hypothetical protein